MWNEASINNLGFIHEQPLSIWANKIKTDNIFYFVLRNDYLKLKPIIASI